MRKKVTRITKDTKSSRMVLKDTDTTVSKGFFTGRKQIVVLNGFKSEWTTVTSGVPPGGVRECQGV